LASTVATPASRWTSFLKTVTRFEKEKIAPWIALRNAAGVAIPLAAGYLLGSPRAGLALASGGLNVSFSDSHEPHARRARRMLAASLLVGLAAFAGGIVGRSAPLVTVVAGLAAFPAGLVVTLGAAAADLALLSLCLVIVYAAVPLSPHEAAYAGLLASAGGIFQTVLSLLFWPLRRFTPVRNALGSLFRELARTVDAPIDASEPPPASLQRTEARAALAPLDSNRAIEAQRYRMLLSEAERLLLSILALRRIRSRMRRELPDEPALRSIERFFVACSAVLTSIASALTTGDPAAALPERLGELQAQTRSFREMRPPDDPVASAMLDDARRQMDAIAGQLRAGVELSSTATQAGLSAFELREALIPRTLRVASAVSILRANLNLDSASFRHAVRLAVCVAAGEAIAHLLGLERSYWLPMTIAIVLRPDFATTFSRGVLRLTGTLAGLALSTFLFWALPSSPATDISLITVMMFVLRCFGPANYGIFAVAITALIVLLIGITGVAPSGVIAARGLNTVAGGLIALAAYRLWPTWERKHVGEVLAAMLDAYRDYFRMVRENYIHAEGRPSVETEPVRLAGRLARSNLEASMDRLAVEPGTSPDVLRLLSGILASSHRLIHAVMSLEAGLAASAPVPARAAFRTFADHVEFTLYYLAAALRGSPLTAGMLPDLREDHQLLVSSGDPYTARYALVNVETDRITNSLNTISMQILAVIELGGLAQT
jgi:uncharacterized membrane protein YccC